MTTIKERAPQVRVEPYKKTTVLIDPHSPTDEVCSQVRNASFSATLPSGFVGCRCRGTSIHQTAQGYTIVGWQKNFARLRKMDVALPTIITLELDHQKRIQNIFFDDSFKGSQGILCSHSYLSENITQKLKGSYFLLEHAKQFLVKEVHCYHIMEVLVGALSCFHDFLQGNSDRYGEVESCESYLKGGNLVTVGRHEYNGGETEDYALILHDIERKGVAVFNNKGQLARLDQVITSFSLSDEIQFVEVLDADNPRDCSKALLNCFTRSVEYLSEQRYGDPNTIYAHSGLYPYSFTGVFIQALAICTFPGNYDYVTQAIRALSRHKGKPYCVGAIEDSAEAQTYFPGFRI